MIGSHGAVTAPAAAPLNRVEGPARPVLEEVGNVADSVAVRQEVPAAGAVAVVVEPGSEDQVGRGAEEDAGGVFSVSGYCSRCKVLRVG